MSETETSQRSRHVVDSETRPSKNILETMSSTTPPHTNVLTYGSSHLPVSSYPENISQWSSLGTLFYVSKKHGSPFFSSCFYFQQLVNFLFSTFRIWPSVRNTCWRRISESSCQTECATVWPHILFFLQIWYTAQLFLLFGKLFLLMLYACSDYQSGLNVISCAWNVSLDLVWDSVWNISCCCFVNRVIL